MIAAAWLHDVVEDTPITVVDIEAEFGLEVACLVSMVTDVSSLSDGNRDIRKGIDRIHLACASPKAQTIKYADILDNITDIVTYDPHFAKVYINEKSKLMAIMNGGALELFSKAWAAIHGASIKLREDEE